MVHTVSTPVVTVAVQTKTEVAKPKEIVSENYQPITDPDNVRHFITEYFKDIPIMAKIASCESHNRQTDKYGHIIRGEENPYDVGVMQINELYHADEAANLGFNIYTLDGNVAFARYLYERQGAKPWMSSSACWSKSADLAIAR